MDCTRCTYAAEVVPPKFVNTFPSLAGRMRDSKVPDYCNKYTYQRR